MSCWGWTAVRCAVAPQGCSKSCMLVKYGNADCQRNHHWPTHKKLCKQRAAELHDT